MCGIVGALVFKNSGFSVTERYIRDMRDTMIHRGPDGAGCWIRPDGRLGLGFRRLAIIDLSDAANQPMSNEDGSIWVVFNGEIYNHVEIRAELTRLGGHRWKTDHSDTEVILHAYEEWGIECLERFRGMFAIGLWDGRSRELWIVRDRIGIKPLYYSIHDGRIVFASEIKALLKDPDQKRVVDEEAFYHFLSFLTAPAPHTLFEGIRKLPPATWIKVREDGYVEERRYWDVLDHVIPLISVSEEEISARILSELRTSVRLRKISDVPVGVFLSGGVDSSTNAALFSEGETSPVKTFTIGYEGEYTSYRNELDYARKMARFVGAEGHELLLTADDLIRFLPEMVYIQDEPIADPVCFPVYRVSKMARENGVVVCQVGEGADELFCGYPYWKTMIDHQTLDDMPFPRILKRALLPGLRVIGKERGLVYEWVRRGSEGVPLFWGGAEAFTQEQKRRLLSPRLRKRFVGMSSWDALRPIRARFEEKAWERNPLNWMSYLDLNLRLPELLLMRVDKMSMAVSLEGRVPFLDHKFVELSMSIPAAMKTKDDTLKYILKKSVRGIIPDELIDREKQGFSVPIYEWFLGGLGERVHEILKNFISRTDFLDPVEVERLVAARQGPNLWYLLNFAMWWERYFVS
jgi:asparagine synthase (glutamine-hydrolysing)